MEFYIKDMMCEGCVKRVTKALIGIGCENVYVDLKTKKVTITNSLDSSVLKNAIDKLGFTYSEK
jgi:copper chaperone CopZ